MVESIINLPVKILSMIFTYDLETFIAALDVPKLGNILCDDYIQNNAKNRFTVIKYSPQCGVISHYLAGRLHRNIGPAIYANGTKYWYRYGKLHRENGPAIEYSDGGKRWYKYGKLHRDDGPAVEHYNGGKEWYKYGKLYREIGPVIICSNGRRYYFEELKQYHDMLPIQSLHMEFLPCEKYKDDNAHIYDMQSTTPIMLKTRI